MRYLSLCSGIEAATVAWHPMGWEPAAFAEIEAFPAAVLRHHYPSTPNLGDMTKWREWDVGAIDLLVGGTPCQSFSVAGLRKGLSDPRGGLMLTFLEIAQSLRPRWVVWENVPGVLSSGGGRDFGSFLGALGDLGYGWAYRVLDAQWCRVDGYERAVPQRRRRVFVVGCLGDATSAAKVLFEQQSVERNPAPRGKARQGTAADAEGGAGAGGCYWDGSDCAATLTKQNASGAQRMPDKANSGAVLQPICIDRSAYNQGQNAKWDCPIEQSDAMFGLIARGPHAIAVPFRKSHRAASATDDESWVRAETANTLNRFDTGERDTHAVAFTVDMQACKGKMSIGDGSVSPTLCKPSGSDVHAVAFAQNQLGEVRCGDVANTVNTNSNASGRNTPMAAVAFTCKDHGADASDVSPTLRAMPHDGSHANGGGQVAIAFNWQNGGGYGNANEGLGITIEGTGPLQRCNTPAVAFKPSHFTRGKDGSPADITPPLSADADKGDQDTVVAYPIDTQNMTEHHSSGGLGFGQRDDPSFTITKGHSHAVAAIAPSLTASNDPSRSPQSAEVTQQIAAVHQATMVVRRLTPVECSRLQGFPDDYLELNYANAEEAHAAQVLHELWREVGTQEVEEQGWRTGISAALLAPQILLAGVHGGWISWSMAERCAAARGSLPGESHHHEGFLRALRKARAIGCSPYGRESIEQLLRESESAVSFVPSTGAQARAILRSSGMWTQAQAKWPLRYAFSEEKARRSHDKLNPDGPRYKALGNSMAVNCMRWIGRRIDAVEKGTELPE